jgi:DNA excision repair protein ERCC-8
MNQLLLERSTGNVGPNAFTKLQTTRLVKSFRPANRFRFDGGEAGVPADATEAGSSSLETRLPTWAHQAGVNALALDRFDGRL